MTYLFSEAADRLSDLERLLAKYGVKYTNDSSFYRIECNVLEVVEKHKKNIPHDDHVDIRPYMREILGFNDFVAKVLSVSGHPEFPKLVPHLMKLTTGSIAQTTEASVTDQDANKLFELYIACLVLPQFQNLTLDHPEHSKGDNPDLLFDAYGNRWAIACKTLHIDKIKPRSIYAAWAKGVDQIDRSGASKGFVLISLRNLVDYDECWPITNQAEVEIGGFPTFAAFRKVNTPTSHLEMIGGRIRDMMIEEFGLGPINTLIDIPKSIGGFVTLSQTATGILIGEQPVPTILRVFNSISFRKFADDELGILCRINDQMQNTS